MSKKTYVCSGISLKFECTTEPKCKLNSTEIIPRFCPYSGNTCTWKKVQKDLEQRDIVYYGPELVRNE